MIPFARRYQCLPIRCSGRLINLQIEHPIDVGTYGIVLLLMIHFSRFENRVRST
jgi:hypothetical protein